jgi:hypothetical protein
MNMDCLFHLNLNTFNTGNASPLNSGWFLIIPDLQDYTALRRQAMQRLGRRWNEEKGWGKGIPKTYLFFRGGKREVRPHAWGPLWLWSCLMKGGARQL